ncbi:hypothetical protein B5X24_HaOG204883 [Helicoverpa armigera]|uniref:Uncharacterized protein n=1 Tax=Helicoverpa armigera TaxID=29058 RepID=A0A2W1BWS8_HELAM|nr:hypothetical protein B5X24_HaOG204883 [Helicoverpa armigera]
MTLKNVRGRVRNGRDVTDKPDEVRVNRANQIILKKTKYAKEKENLDKKNEMLQYLLKGKKDYPQNTQYLSTFYPFPCLLQ